MPAVSQGLLVGLATCGLLLQIYIKAERQTGAVLTVVMSILGLQRFILRYC